MPDRRIHAALVIITAALLASACTASTPTTSGGAGIAAAASREYSPSPSPTASPPASTSPVSVPLCAPTAIAASLNTAHTGEISGRENVVIDLRNTGDHACRIDGYATLTGIAGGHSTVLAFPHDPTLFSTDVAAAGPIPAGGFGRFTATVAVTGCDKTAVHYSKLMITMPAGGVQVMPYPSALATAGCALREGPIGPVTAS